MSIGKVSPTRRRRMVEYIALVTAGGVGARPRTSRKTAAALRWRWERAQQAVDAVRKDWPRRGRPTTRLARLVHRLEAVARDYETRYREAEKRAREVDAELWRGRCRSIARDMDEGRLPHTLIEEAWHATSVPERRPLPRPLPR